MARSCGEDLPRMGGQEGGAVSRAGSGKGCGEPLLLLPFGGVGY